MCVSLSFHDVNFERMKCPSFTHLCCYIIEANVVRSFIQASTLCILLTPFALSCLFVSLVMPPSIHLILLICSHASNRKKEVRRTPFTATRMTRGLQSKRIERERERFSTDKESKQWQDEEEDKQTFVKHWKETMQCTSKGRHREPRKMASTRKKQKIVHTQS